MRILYNLILAVLAPLALPWYAWQVARGPERHAWRERLGGIPPEIEHRMGSPRIWVHAVSVGEVAAAEPVLRELRTRWPDALLLLSTTTRTGQAFARERALPVDLVMHYPVDLLPAVRRALARARPDLVVLTEWEVWPNFVLEAAGSGARVAVVNGRISLRGERRARRARPLFRQPLEAVDAFLMQSAEDARRAVASGAPESRVSVVGNTKFEEVGQPLSHEDRAALRADLGIPRGSPVWVCGSTRPGEEALIAEALGLIRERHPEIVTVVAPRHPERADDAQEALRSRGARVVRRTAGTAPAPGDILLLDTLGELGRVYSLGGCAFVGGSLLPFGGQSLFQPLAQGVPVLFGPHVDNQRDIARLAEEAGVGFRVADATALGSEVSRLLSLPALQRASLEASALELIAINRGVARRAVDTLERLLDRRQPASDGPVPG
jgi:3-deoxy-D-manno-octulosonic-acid transferase